MRNLVVDANVRDGARGREPVDADPGEDLVVGPRVGIGPVVQLLVDPGEQRDGAVGEGVGQRLRLRRLQQPVAGSFLHEPVAARHPGLLGGGVRRQRVLDG